MKRTFNEIKNDMNFENIFNKKKTLLKQPKENNILFKDNEIININTKNISLIIKLLVKINYSIFMVYGKYKNILLKNILKFFNIVEINNKINLIINENVKLIYNFEYSNQNISYILINKEKYIFNNYSALCNLINKLETNNNIINIYINYNYKYYFKYKIICVNNNINYNFVVNKIDCNEDFIENYNKNNNNNTYFKSIIKDNKKLYYHELNKIYDILVKYIYNKILIFDKDINDINNNIIILYDNFTNKMFNNFKIEYLLNINNIIEVIIKNNEYDYLNKFNNLILITFNKLILLEKFKSKFFFADENIKLNNYLSKLCDNKVSYTYINKKLNDYLNNIKINYDNYNGIFTLQDKQMMCKELYNLNSLEDIFNLYYYKKYYNDYYNILY